MIVLYSAGTLIAFCALTLTVFQVWSHRKHNELSMRPQLCLQNQISSDDNSIAVSTVNNGLGPAMIREFELFLDDEPIEQKGVDQVFVITQEVFKNQRHSLSAGHLDIGSLVPVHQSCELFKVDFVLTIDVVEVWFRMKGRIKVVVKYESLYGEKFELNDTVDS